MDVVSVNLSLAPADRHKHAGEAFHIADTTNITQSLRSQHSHHGFEAHFDPTPRRGTTLDREALHQDWIVEHVRPTHTVDSGSVDHDVPFESMSDTHSCGVLTTFGRVESSFALLSQDL